MRFLKKFLKIIGWISLVLFIGLYIAFWTFTSPKSNESVLSEFEDSIVKPIISKEKFKDFEYRKLAINIDKTKPTLVFVHGTIGSCLNFKAYLQDSTLLKNANMIAYDRVGYNYNDKNSVQESIAFEADLLKDMISDLPKENTILVGYSYGGPIALATKSKFKKIILLAPAVYSKVEPMPWLINFYKWKLTRWLIPPIWKEASKEKLSHKKDLQKIENTWKANPSKIISIHGNDDAIVPYENSLFLKEQFPKNQFELVTLNDAGHNLIWSNFDAIKQQLIETIDE